MGKLPSIFRRNIIIYWLCRYDLELRCRICIGNDRWKSNSSSDIYAQMVPQKLRGLSGRAQSDNSIYSVVCKQDFLLANTHINGRLEHLRNGTCNATTRRLAVSMTELNWKVDVEVTIAALSSG